MVCRRITSDSPLAQDELRQMLAARRAPSANVDERVAEILEEVANSGDDALVAYTRAFDCPVFTAEMIPVPHSAIQAAYAEVPESDIAIIDEAAANIRSFHQAQVQRSWWSTQSDGTVLGQIVRPVDRAGLYVPGGMGGETPLISSLLMTAIPAQVAGVRGIAVVSPPRADGSLNPYILAAAGRIGITEIYRCGSAWAVAALAMGTATIPAVDVIAGPGNIYVTTAKRMLIGRVGIDMIAGPSEIAILADDSADPEWIAADMLSQCEHDALAASFLVTPSSHLADAVCESLTAQLEALPRNEIARKALADWSAVILTPSLDAGCDVVNRIAPEHLELLVARPWETLASIRHAGAIFLGPYSPEPMGDYFAGPNHVLPTLGTARFASALSVEHFVKKSSLIAASQANMRRNGAKIARLARLEGLEAHARSVECRK